MKRYWYWVSEYRGLIRTYGDNPFDSHPEVWRDGGWITGSPYEMDAITGMGEDSWSCGEMARDITQEEAVSYAKTHGIEL